MQHFEQFDQTWNTNHFTILSSTTTPTIRVLLSTGLLYVVGPPLGIRAVTIGHSWTMLKNNLGS